MRKSWKNRLRDWKLDIKKTIMHFLPVIVLLIALLLDYKKWFRTLIKVNEVLPHVITFASCNLTLIGFVLALVLGLKGGAVHSKLAESPKIMKSLYNFIFSVCCSTVLTILMSIAVLSLPSWSNVLVEKLFALLGLGSFLHMLIGTLYLLFFLIALMIKDDGVQKAKASN